MAKTIFKTLRGQIPVDAEEILFQAAHLESRQLQYQKATQRLADRAAHVKGPNMARGGVNSLFKNLQTH